MSREQENGAIIRRQNLQRLRMISGAPLLPCGRGVWGEGWECQTWSNHPHPGPLPSREWEKHIAELDLNSTGRQVLE